MWPTSTRSSTSGASSYLRPTPPQDPPTDSLSSSKHNVQNQTSELEALEKRIKEMEARLKRGSTSGHPRGALSLQQHQQPEQDEAGPPPPPKDQEKTKSRPGTARQIQPPAPSSANMPPTPTASEGEYELIGKEDLDDGPAPSTNR